MHEGSKRQACLSLPLQRATPAASRTYTAYPLFDRSRPWNVCRRFCMATALTEMNRYDSFNICMETTTLHAYIDGRPTNRLRWSCGSAEPYQQEKLRTRALLNENVRGGQVQPPGWCSRFVCSTWSTSLLAHAPKVVRSLGSQQKYCVTVWKKVGATAVCVMSIRYYYWPNGSGFI